jgi:hypothetical protein
MPTYTANRSTQQGREAFHWRIPEIWESECPVSSISQRSFELVQIVNMLQTAKESTGSTVGADEMPGFLLDAVRICESESRTVETAMEEANS